MKGWMHACMKNEWMYESINKWMLDYECMNAWKHETNGWMDKWMNEWFDEWMNDWINR